MPVWITVLGKLLKNAVPNKHCAREKIEGKNLIMLALVFFYTRVPTVIKCLL